jgi:cytochrome c biogenesis protein CcmG/thiol:disulfide interchange protein DsbE
MRTKEGPASSGVTHVRTTRRALTLASILLVVGGLIALLAFGLANQTPVTGKSGITRVGKPAADFSLPLIGGGDLVLEEQIGRPLVINFWASWCPPCVQEAPALESAWRTYRSEEVLFVGVDIQDAEEDAAEYVRDLGITYPNVLDRDGRVTIDYGVIGLPVTFFVNRDGIIQRRWVGAIDERRLAEFVEELIAGTGPSDEGGDGNQEGYVEFD